MMSFLHPLRLFILMLVVSCALFVGKELKPDMGRSLLPFAHASVDMSWSLRTTSLSPIDYQVSQVVDRSSPPEASVTVPSHPFRTGLILIHVFGLVIGMGSALFMDFKILGNLYSKPVTRSDIEMMRFGGRLTTSGLCLLWMSGLGFLAFYWHFAPDALANQKIWAKFVVVSMLTINGILIHKIALPSLQLNLGHTILGRSSLTSASPMLAIASVSITGWTFATTLGLVKELNYAFEVPQFLIGYASLALFTFLIAVVAHLLARTIYCNGSLSMGSPNYGS